MVRTYLGKNRSEQNVFYLHGALPYFDSGVAIVKEEYNVYNYLLQNISARMEKGEYPIFVTAGDGQQKLSHITHNQYQTYCYDNFCQAEGSLVTFGFRFGPNDEHIIAAINRAVGLKAPNKLWSSRPAYSNRWSFTRQEKPGIKPGSSRYAKRI